MYIPVAGAPVSRDAPSAKFQELARTLGNALVRVLCNVEELVRTLVDARLQRLLVEAFVIYRRIRETASFTSIYVRMISYLGAII